MNISSNVNENYSKEERPCWRPPKIVIYKTFFADSHEDHANFDVSAADGPGDSGLHLECVQLPRYPEK